MTIRTSEITLPNLSDIRRNLGGYKAQADQGHIIRFLLSSHPSSVRPLETARLMNMERFNQEWGDHAFFLMQLTLFRQQPKQIVDRLNHWGAIVVHHAGQKQYLFGIIKDESDAGI
jgi:hypothetical protein